jgi:hypothetical protein
MSERLKGWKKMLLKSFITSAFQQTDSINRMNEDELVKQTPRKGDIEMNTKIDWVSLIHETSSELLGF